MPIHKHAFYYFLFFTACWGFTSCVSPNKLSYIHKGNFTRPELAVAPYLIKTGDNLHIEIKSPDPSTSSYYNLSGEFNSNSYNQPFLFVSSYIVDPVGNIQLPYLGDISVTGKSLPEIKVLVESKLTDHLREASVYVKLVNYKISVLGEVSHPGQYFVYQENPISIFEALALAGDITKYGKRSEVVIFRNSTTGTTEITLDLGNYEALKSAGYMIYPHDVIYVSPLRYKSFEMNLKGITVLLSAAGVIILFMRTL